MSSDLVIRLADGNNIMLPGVLTSLHPQEWLETLSQNIVLVPDLMNSLIAIGSCLCPVSTTGNAWIPDETIFHQAHYLLMLQHALAKDWHAETQPSWATDNLAVAPNLDRHAVFEGIREQPVESMSGWWIFPATSHYGVPDFSRFQKIRVSDFVATMPKLAKYLFLPENFRFWDDGAQGHVQHEGPLQS